MSEQAVMEIPARRVGHFLMQVLWPSFLMAAVGVGVVFSMIDPQELVVVGLHLADSREAAYTVGFFLMWGMSAASSALTWTLSNRMLPDSPENR
jgi:hypothetical protein